MKTHRHLLLLVPLSFSLALLETACRGPLQGDDDVSKVADVSIRDIDNQDYTSYQFALDQQDGTFKIPRTSFNRGGQSIAVKVPVGTYKITLDYFKGTDLILSTTFCKEGVRNDVQKFVAGPNQVDLVICNIKAEPQTSTVIVKPVPMENAGKPMPVAGDTFTIQNASLIDPSGKPFILRGINMPFAYYFNQSFDAIETAKLTGFNSVRIVWCANNFKDSGGRCQDKDFFSAADLDRVITKLTDARLVTVFNLQNATGQDTVEPLLLMADYMLLPEIKAVLMKHKRHVIINIANEWMGQWAKNRNWVDGYRAVIDKLRKGGLPHVLIVDARGWGQDFSSIEEHAKELMALDKNLIFSSHIYAVYNTDQIVQEKFKYIRDNRIPFMVGEFGCTHYDDASSTNKTVACDAVMREAAQSSYPIGTMAWSFTGNRDVEKDLDVFQSANWKELTEYGKRVVDGAFGVKATAKQACYFDPAQCR